MRAESPDQRVGPSRQPQSVGRDTVTRPPPPAVEQRLTPRTTRRGRGCCLTSFALAALIMGCSCACLAVASSRLSQTARPPTTVLVLGLDRRPEQDYAVRSDVVMLVTAYPRDPGLGLLSIPRDLYVEIPGRGKGRVNAAHFWGEREEPGGGPDLAMRTVSALLGVPIQDYVRVDFDAFRAVIDALGGIEVVVEEGIVDDAYPTEDYGTMSIEIPAGSQIMDGERALQYVRSRHGASDFERAARQQEVMMAIARRLSAPANWQRLPGVSWALVRHTDTSLGPAGLIRLAVAALRVGPDGIEHYVIGRDMTRPWTTPGGGAVLLPRWEVINPMVESLFAP